MVESSESIIQSLSPTTPPTSKSEDKILTINHSIIKSHNSTYLQLWRDHHNNQSFNYNVKQFHLPPAVAGQSPQSIIQSSSPTTPPTSSFGGTITTINRSIIMSNNSTFLLLWLDNHHNQSFNHQVPQLHVSPAVTVKSSQSIIRSSSPTTPPSSSCGRTILTINNSTIKSHNSTYLKH